LRCDRVWTNARLATLAPGRPGLGGGDGGLVAASGGRVLYAGAAGGGPGVEAAEVVDCGARWITPGLIDPYTHLVFAGDRAHEFELRLNGASYEEIARAGGGIVSTMAATRVADEAALLAATLPRLDALLAEGVATVEVKSGYGLSLEHELKCLRVARRLGEARGVDVRVTFLGAHAAPPEFRDDPDAYVDLVCDEMIPAVAAAGLADAVDAFCETIGFSPDQVRRVFAAARAQVESGALRADHLGHLTGAGVAGLGRAGPVATLLPGAFYFTRGTGRPPIEALRAAGVPMALATDCNPGTSPLTSPLMAMNMAATLFRMTVEECLAGFTREAARALGLLHDTGSLEAGKQCDLAIWDVERPAELVYRMGFNPLHARVWRGQ